MKKFLIALLSFIFLIAAGVGIFFLTFDLNTYRDTITGKLTEMLGRPVTIGDLETKLAWIPTIKARNIEIKNPDGFSATEPLARIDSAEVTLAVAPLLDKRAEILDVSLGNVEVFLARKGNWGNWEGNGRENARPAVSAKNKWKTRVDSIYAKSVRVNYQDESESWGGSVSQMSLKQLKVFSFTFEVAHHPFKVSGTIDDLLALLDHKPDYLFNVEVTGADTTAKVSGSIGDTQSFKDILLNVEASGTGLRQTMDQMGIKGNLFPMLPFKVSTVLQGNLRDVQLTQMVVALDGSKLQANFDGGISDITTEPKLEITGQIALTDAALAQMWGIKPFTSDVTIEATPERIDIKQFNYRSGRSDIQVLGYISLTGTKPRLDVSIISEYLDVNDVVIGNSEDYDSLAVNKTKKIENKPIDLSGLNLFDGSIAVVMPHIRMTDDVAGYLGIDSRMAVQDGVLSTKNTQIRFLDGRIALGATVSGGNHQAIQLVAQGENLSLDAIRAFQGTIQNGRVDIGMNVETQGKTTYEMLEGLKGVVQAEIVQGTIVHSWFNETVDLLKTHKKKSFTFSTTDKLNQVVCGAMDLQLKDGKLVSDDSIIIESTDIAFRASGSIGLLSGDLNMSILPLLYQPKEATDDVTKNSAMILAAVAQLIQLTGPIQDPQLSLGEHINVSQASLRYTDKYRLCAQVLKRDPKGYVLSEAKKRMMLPKVEIPEENEVPQSNQDKFRQQLLETITKATQE